ncbi:MAG TPA: acyl carrier protein [Pseudonocardiaceae bacterium]
MNAIEERITRILLDDFKVRVDPIGPDSTFADLGFDSLVIVELTLVLDNEFGIALEDGELSDMMTIAEAAEVVATKSPVKGTVKGTVA